MAIQIISHFVDALALRLGLPPDLVRMAFCLFTSYPLCGLMKRLPERAKARQVYCISVTVFYLVGVFDLWKGLLTLLANSLFTYTLARALRNNPFMPWINFAVVLGWLLKNHIAAQSKDSYNVNDIDITGSQMVLCMKLSSFAWNVYDGTLDAANLTELQKKRSIVKTDYPPLVDFLTYALFFPSIFTGPSCDYAEFATWVDLSMFAEVPAVATRKRRIPSSSVPATKKGIEGIAWIILWVVSVKYVSLGFAQSEDFVKKRTFFFRIFYLYVLGITYRLKYYGAWCIAEGACILSGLGFHGKDPKNPNKYKWDRVRNIDPWRVETSQNTHVLLESWNMNTNKWLKNYIYLRVTPKGKKPGLFSSFITFVTSAIWHGTRPGYYLTFATGAFFQSLGKSFRRNIRPIFLQPDQTSPAYYKPVYDLVCWFVTQISFGYLVQPFILLDMKPSLKLWGTVYFYVHWILLVCMLLFHGPLKRPVVKYLASLRPKSLKELTATEKLAAEAAKLRQIQQDIADLNILGVPVPDVDNFEGFDEEYKKVLAEIDEVRDDIIAKLHQGDDARKTASTGKAEKTG